MQHRLLFRPSARRDVQEIADYTAQRWGETQVESYMEAISSALDRLCDNPALGTDMSHLRVGLRKYVVASHAIYYFDEGSHLRVSRILHVRMDPGRRLG